MHRAKTTIICIGKVKIKNSLRKLSLTYLREFLVGQLSIGGLSKLWIKISTVENSLF